MGLAFCLMLLGFAIVKAQCPLDHPSLDSALSPSFVRCISIPEIDQELQVVNENEARFVLLLTKSRKARMVHDTLTSMMACGEAMAILPITQRNRCLAAIRLEIGLIYRGRNAYEACASNLFVADSLATVAGDSVLKAESLLALAECYRLSHALDKALEMAQLAEKVAVRNAHKTMVAKLMQISIMHQLHSYKNDTNAVIAASRLVRELEAMPELKKSPSAAAQLMCEKGSLELAKKHYEEAILAFEQSALSFRENGDMPNYCSVRGSIFDAYRDIRKPQFVAEYGKASLDSCRKYGFHDRDSEFLSGVMQAYEKMGDYENAFHYSRLHFYEKLRLDSIQNREQVLAIEALYQSTKRKAELSTLTQEKTLLEIENENNQARIRLLLFGGSIVLVLLLLLLAFMVRAVRNAKNIRQQSIQLKAQNLTIAKTLEEKEFLFKELHHRVKNNLQLLSSFLTLQISHHPDQLPEDFLQAVEKKIKAMSLVHEQLYRSSEIGNLMLREYYQDISDHLLGSLGAALPELEINIEGPEIYVNVDKAIPLGLIMNEIVTNSIKHAFSQAEQDPVPMISIQMENAPDGNAVLHFHDNGPGFPTHFDPLGAKQVGARVIVLLARQLNGTLEFFNEAGAVWRLSFPTS